MNQNETNSWWKNAVAYQIYPRSFCDSNGDGIGDLGGIINKLDYLKELGITLIWICPIYDSPNDDNGYDIRDYEKIAGEFGTMAEFDELLKQAHLRGIRVIMDLVVNHTSDEHPWFIESAASRDNDKSDWYIWKDPVYKTMDGVRTRCCPNNWESIFGNSVWEWNEDRQQYYFHVFGQKMPDINWENRQAKEAVFTMIRGWLDKGIDGFRIDAISHIKKNDYEDLPNPEGKEFVSSFEKHMNQPGIMELLTELKDECFAGRDIFTIGEASGVSSEQMKDWISEETGKFSSIFQFEHHHLWGYTKEKTVDIPRFRKVLSDWQKIAKENEWIALFLENHDLVRSIDRFGDPGKYWKESAKCLALICFMQKGIPFIYQGQEIGMVNADYTEACTFTDRPPLLRYEERIAAGTSEKESFEELKATTRDNSRTPMQWDETPGAGFTEGIPWMPVNHNCSWLNVKQQQSDPDSIFHFYQEMIRIRQSVTDLIYGNYHLVMEESDQIFAYIREGETDRYLICANLSAQTIQLPSEWDRLAARIPSAEVPLLSSYSDSRRPQDTLRPYEAYLIKLL